MFLEKKEQQRLEIYDSPLVKRCGRDARLTTKIQATPHLTVSFAASVLSYSR